MKAQFPNNWTFPCQSTTDSEFYDYEKARQSQLVWSVVCLMSVFTKKNYKEKS